jgi:hypothetical protein
MFASAAATDSVRNVPELAFVAQLGQRHSPRGRSVSHFR